MEKVSKAKGYMIQYSTSKKFKRSQTKTKYATKMNLMVKKLKSKKAYYFRMKAYTKALEIRRFILRTGVRLRSVKFDGGTFFLSHPQQPTSPSDMPLFYIPIYAVINLKCILQPQKIQK